MFAGDLRGSGNTVWFVYRPDLTAKLTGCLLPASGTRAGHCLPGDPYRLTWSLKGNTLLRTDLCRVAQCPVGRQAVAEDQLNRPGTLTTGEQQTTATC